MDPKSSAKACQLQESCLLFFGVSARSFVSGRSSLSHAKASLCLNVEFDFVKSSRF